jgi:hypothetical protein
MLQLRKNFSVEARRGKFLPFRIRKMEYLVPLTSSRYETSPALRRSQRRLIANRATSGFEVHVILPEAFQEARRHPGSLAGFSSRRSASGRVAVSPLATRRGGPDGPLFHIHDGPEPPGASLSVSLPHRVRCVT